MRLRAVYAFDPRAGALAMSTGAPTRFARIPATCRDADDIRRFVGDNALCWGHVVEIQEVDAIFITTCGEIERVPIGYLRCLDFAERAP